MKAILNPSLQRLSGKMGDMTFRWMYGKQTVMKTPDMSRVKWSKAQEEHRERFREAIFYAKSAMADPQARAHYEKVAAKKGRRPFHVAVSDYFKGNDLLSKK